MSRTRVGLALGANLGRPRHQLLAALVELSRQLGTLAVAPLYRSSPDPPLPQPDYFNSVVLARTTLSPGELLRLAKQLERSSGRSAGPRFAPRPLDVDLLFYGDQQVAEPELIVPHPRLRERAFALAPLADLAPTLPLPPDGRTAEELLRSLPRPLQVRRVSWLADEVGPSPGG